MSYVACCGRSQRLEAGKEPAKITSDDQEGEIHTDGLAAGVCSVPFASQIPDIAPGDCY